MEIHNVRVNRTNNSLGQNRHEWWMDEALDQARIALKKNEVPVGAVSVSYTHLTLPTILLV